MLTGTAGTGKRAAAAWFARDRLGIAGNEALPGLPGFNPGARGSPLGHPTGRQAFHRHRSDSGSRWREISLTSYEGGGKVAVIEPADAMTTSAANGLLKTLEEPPGDTLLVLVVDRPGKLPATIFSRCQRINISAPPEHDGLAWLQRLQPGDQTGRKCCRKRVSRHWRPFGPWNGLTRPTQWPEGLRSAGGRRRGLRFRSPRGGRNMTLSSSWAG